MKDKLNEKINHKILVVDDMASQALILREILQDLGHEIHIENSGKSAIEATRKEHFSVILLDVYMPDMDGFKVAEILREDEATENIPIIFITAKCVSKELEFTGFNKGAVDFIYKPVAQEAIQSKVRWLISLREESIRLHRTLVLMKQVNRQNELLINNALQGILWISKDGVIHMANPAALKMLNYQGSEICQSSISNYLCCGGKNSVINWASFIKRLVEVKEHSSHSEDIWFKRKDGDSLQVGLDSSAIVNEKNECEGVVLIFEDITERKKAEDNLRHLAQYDSLTGLANRRKLIEFGNTRLSSLEPSQKPAILFIDLDGFKKVNDDLGHEAGDKVLIDAAKVLGETIEGESLIARFGGDEFAIFISHVDDKDALTLNANELVMNVAKINKVFDNDIELSASVGIALYPEAGTDFSSLLQSADTAMYSAKKKGKNRISFFSQENQKAMARSMKIIEILSRLNYNDFISHYQPIYDAAGEEIIFIEAFLALKINDDDFVKAEDFIKKANKLSVLEQIFDWQINKILEDLSENLSEDNKVGLSLNFTGTQLLDSHLINKLIEKIDNKKIDRRKVCIDIDVGELSSLNGKVLSIIENLKKDGFRIAIENFNLCCHVPNELYTCADMIKISRSLIEGVGQDKEKEKIIKAIIYLCDQFGVDVCAVGVDSKEKSEFLRATGAKYLQGHAFSNTNV